jgi:hypothetical protein
MEMPNVSPEARLNRDGLTTFVLSTQADPEHRQAWALVRDGEADRAVVRNADGYILFRAWRSSAKSWCWQSSTMGVPAFMPYPEAQS